MSGVGTGGRAASRRPRLLRPVVSAARPPTQICSRRAKRLHFSAIVVPLHPSLRSASSPPPSSSLPFPPLSPHHRRPSPVASQSFPSSCPSTRSKNDLALYQHAHARSLSLFPSIRRHATTPPLHLFLHRTTTSLSTHLGLDLSYTTSVLSSLNLRVLRQPLSLLRWIPLHLPRYSRSYSLWPLHTHAP